MRFDEREGGRRERAWSKAIAKFLGRATAAAFLDEASTRMLSESGPADGDVAIDEVLAHVLMLHGISDGDLNEIGLEVMDLVSDLTLLRFDPTDQ